MNRLIAMIAAVAVSAAALAACDALQTLGPAVAGARNFTFHYKKLPPGYFVARAALLMAHRHDSLGYPNNFADRILCDTTGEEYHGNKQGNSNHFQLNLIEPGRVSQQGQLSIQVQDLIRTRLETSAHLGAVGLNIEAIPLPTVGDTVTSAQFTLTVTEDGDAEVPTDFVNNRDARSYLRLVVTSIDSVAQTCAGTFEALVKCESGPHAGEIYAITDGEFLMDIRQ